MSKKAKEIEITSDEWVEAMFGVYKTEPPKGSFCLNDVMKKTGMKYDSARTKLRIKVEQGELSAEKYLINGKLTKYYLPIKKKK